MVHLANEYGGQIESLAFAFPGCENTTTTSSRKNIPEEPKKEVTVQTQKIMRRNELFYC